MIRRILLFLALSSAGWSQQSAFQHIFTATHTLGPSPALRNVGQGAHIFLVVVTGNAMCPTPTGTFSMRMEFSFDNGVTWTVFGAPFSMNLQGPPPQSQVFVGAGVFPQVRFNLVSFDTTNCAVDVWYSGSQIGTGLTQVSGPLRPNTVIGSVKGPDVNPILTGIMDSGNTMRAVFGCGGGPNLQPPGQGTVAAGTTSVVLTTPAVSFLNTVCGFVVTLSALGTVEFVSGNGAGCATGTQALTPAWTLAAGVPLQIYAPFGSALFSSSNQICLAATGGAAAYLINFAVLQ